MDRWLALRSCAFDASAVALSSPQCPAIDGA